MNALNVSLLMIYAARYAHGRNTGAALQVTSYILAEWDNIDKRDKKQLYHDSFEAAYCQEDWKRLQDRFESEIEEQD